LNIKTYKFKKLKLSVEDYKIQLLTEVQQILAII